jgi:F-type H+-transporting ATPase subunit b
MLNLFAQVVYLAAEEEPEGIDLVIPEMNELIGGIIAFGIVFAAVWIWARPAIARALEARQQAIAGQLTHAEEAKAEAESLLEDYRRQLAQAREEANRIVEEARRQAEAVKADIVAKAQAEVAEQRRRADEEIDAEWSRLSAALQDRFKDFSLELAQRAVRQTVDRDAQKALIDAAIADIGTLRLTPDGESG